MDRKRFLEDMMAGYLEDLRSLKVRPTVHIKSMATGAVLAELSQAMTSLIEEGTITETESRELWDWFGGQMEAEGLVSPQKGNGSIQSEEALVAPIEAVYRDGDSISSVSPMLQRLERLARSIPQPNEQPVLQEVIPVLHEVELAGQPATFVSLECWSHGYSLQVAIPSDESALAGRPKAWMDGEFPRWFEWDARDDLGGIYAGYGGGGAGAKYWMRQNIWFTPDLDLNARALTIRAFEDSQEPLTVATVALSTRPRRDD